MDPIDDIHRDCLAAQGDIRRRFKLLRYHASMWEPQPMPPKKEKPSWAHRPST